MRLSELALGEEYLHLLESEGISELYPPQEDAVKSGLLDGENMLLCTPTASGKTLAAEFAMIKALENKSRVVYVVPLKALAYEKYVEFRKYEKLGFKVRLETGDIDSGKYQHRFDYDILVATAEKCDSILRSRPEWFNDVRLLVMDEIHLITSDRGPVYEIIITKLRRLYPGIQVLGLSATVGNAPEMASWLKANLVESKWRPVQLLEYVVVGLDVKSKLKEIVQKSIASGGQILVFVNSRKSAESVALKFGRKTTLIGDEDAARLEKTSAEVLDSLSSPTVQCKRLAECVKDGAAFHHAGLVGKQRTLIEDSFKAGLIKVIVATPTLAAGVNLPSRVVVLRDVKRYGVEGMYYIPVLEYKQQVGRAGRPRYDTVGEAVTIARSEEEQEYITEKYVKGEPEPINSQLGVEPVLRFHVLASIASNFTRSRESLMEFFKATFFGFQYGVEEKFENMIEDIILELEDWGFIKQQGNYLTPTPLGGRVSELYIDPMTAHNFILLLGKAEKENRFPTLGLLEMICDSTEIRPLLKVKHAEESKIWGKAYSREKQLLRDLSGFDLDYEFLDRFKTARMFQAWIKEKTEDYILKKYKIAPGILHQKLQVIEWLAYAGSEIARLMKFKRSHNKLKVLEVRLNYGVRRELLELVMLKGIGRVRARALHSAGFKTVKDLKSADARKIGSIIGVKTAEKVMRS